MLDLQRKFNPSILPFNFPHYKTPTLKPQISIDKEEEKKSTHTHRTHSAMGDIEKKQSEDQTNNELKKSAVQIKVRTKTHVKPGKKIGRKECQLVTFDLPYLAFYYNQKLILYKGDFLFEDAVQRLKDGLAIVLEEFHPLAGKLDTDEDGVFKVVYDDADEMVKGVEIIEAEVESGDDGGMLSVDDVIAKEDMSFLKEFLPLNLVLNFEGTHLPLLSVQLTKLRDGLAMGCAFNHAVLDGTSTWHFMSSWAEICRGPTTTVSVLPLHDRTKARNTRVKLDLSAPANPHAPADPAAAAAAAVAAAPLLREKVFKFSESAIDKIKATINNANTAPDAKPFSTFQSLSVHIWRAVTAARKLKPEDYTVFTIFADCRKRIDPPMPESYFGNLIQAVFTVTAAGLLAGNPVDFGAGMIRSAIENHDAKEIEKRNKEWEEKPVIFQYKDAGVNCVAVGSSPRFKVYDVDFGFGRPEIVRSGLNNRFDGMVYLYPGKSGGRSIDVEISLDPTAMDNLEKDKEFLMEEI